MHNRRSPTHASHFGVYFVYCSDAVSFTNWQHNIITILSTVLTVVLNSSKMAYHFCEWSTKFVLLGHMTNQFQIVISSTGLGIHSLPPPYVCCTKYTIKVMAVFRKI